jgi:serine/threonine-protein kinase RsbW
MSICWSLHLRREAASVPLARRLLLGTMETAGVDPDISHDLSVALTEACANAVEHSAEGDYSVTAHIDGDRCRIEVADAGPGFPAERPRPHALVRPLSQKPLHSAQHAEHGRGLFLIEALVDHVHFANAPGRGAVVSFDKILRWRADALLKAS